MVLAGHGAGAGSWAELDALVARAAMRVVAQDAIQVQAAVQGADFSHTDLMAVV